MSGRRLHPITIGAGVLLTLFLFFVAHEDQPGQRVAAQTGAARPESAGNNKGPALRQIVLPVRYGLAADLAKTLSEHFKGHAEVQVLSEPVSNCLLITAGSMDFDGVLKSIALLDKAPQPVSIEVVLVEIATSMDKPATPAPTPPDLDDKEFAGTVEDVTAKLEALAKAGKTVSVKRFRMTGLENQLSTVQDGAERSVVSNVVFNTAKKVAHPITSRRATGTIVRVTPRLMPEGDALLDIVVSDDRISASEEGLVLGEGEEGPIIAPTIASYNATAKVRVSPGQTAVVNAVRSETKAKSSRLIAIVSAQAISSVPKK